MSEIGTAGMSTFDANKRRAYRYKLIENWLSVHRPDVIKAIEEEVDNKYPLPVRADRKIELPASLAKLK